jgi:hypothetical protein
MPYEKLWRVVEETTSWGDLSHEQGVCHTVALPFTLKKYVKAIEIFWKLQKCNVWKILLKKPISFKMLSRYN